MPPKGVIIQPSPHPVKETIDRLQTFLQQHGVTIYARIDQQSELKKVALDIPPLEFIISLIGFFEVESDIFNNIIAPINSVHN